MAAVGIRRPPANLYWVPAKLQAEVAKTTRRRRKGQSADHRSTSAVRRSGRRNTILVAATAATILAVAWYLASLTGPMTAGHPLDCLGYEQPWAMAGDGDGWWVSLNVTTTYDCWQRLQVSACTNFTLTFVFRFANGSESSPARVSIDISQHTGPGTVFVSTPRLHWAAPEPPVTVNRTSQQCLG